MNINNMSNFDYLYDIKTGKTVAAKASTNESAENSTGQVTDEKGNQWLTFDGYDAANVGSVEDLDVEMVVSLLMNGDLTISEFEKYIQAKGIKLRYNSVSNLENNRHHIEFSYENKDYDFYVTVESAAKQTDSVGNYLDRSYRNHDILEGKGPYTEEQLFNTGFISDYYLNQYFKKNNDGSYTLKSPVYVQGEEVHNAEELRKALEIPTLEEYVFDNTNTRLFDYGSSSSVGLEACLSYLGASGSGVIGTTNKRINDKYTNLLQYNSYLDKIAQYNPEYYQKHVMDDGDRMVSILIENGYINKEDFNAKKIQEAALNFDSDYLNSLYSKVQDAIKQYLQDTAAGLGRDVETLTNADIKLDIMERFPDYKESVFKAYRDFQITSIMSFDVEGTGGCGIGFDEARNGNSFYEEPPYYGMPDYIHDLKSYNTTDLSINALFKAAGITDADSIDQAVEKVQTFIENLAKENNMVDKWGRVQSSSVSYNDIFEYLMINGYLEQTTYTEDFLKTSYGLTDEEISKYYYSVDADGNPLKDAKGNTVYKLKGEPGYDNKLEGKPYDVSEAKYDMQTTDSYVNNINMSQVVNPTQAEDSGYIVISTPQQFLEELNRHPDAHFVLECDLDMSTLGEKWIPVGTVDNPFTGTIHGNGHTIKNLTINASNSQYAGLFGVFSGEAYNLKLENINVTNSTKSAGVTSAGVFAGKVVSSRYNVDYKGNIIPGQNLESVIDSVTIIGSSAKGADVNGLIAGMVLPNEGDQHPTVRINDIECQDVNGNIAQFGYIGGGTSNPTGYNLLGTEKEKADFIKSHTYWSAISANGYGNLVSRISVQTQDLSSIHKDSSVVDVSEVWEDPHAGEPTFLDALSAVIMKNFIDLVNTSSDKWINIDSKLGLDKYGDGYCTKATWKDIVDLIGGVTGEARDALVGLCLKTLVNNCEKLRDDMGDNWLRSVIAAMGGTIEYNASPIYYTEGTGNGTGLKVDNIIFKVSDQYYQITCEDMNPSLKEIHPLKLQGDMHIYTQDDVDYLRSLGADNDFIEKYCHVLSGRIDKSNYEPGVVHIFKPSQCTEVYRYYSKESVQELAAYLGSHDYKEYTARKNAENYAERRDTAAKSQGLQAVEGHDGFYTKSSEPDKVYLWDVKDESFIILNRYEVDENYNYRVGSYYVEFLSNGEYEIYKSAARLEDACREHGTKGVGRVLTLEEQKREPYYAAIVQAQRLGLNFTDVSSYGEYPFVCEKNGVIYDFNKETCQFEPRGASKPKTKPKAENVTEDTPAAEERPAAPTRSKPSVEQPAKVETPSQSVTAEAEQPAVDSQFEETVFEEEQVIQEQEQTVVQEEILAETAVEEGQVDSEVYPQVVKTVQEYTSKRNEAAKKIPGLIASSKVQGLYYLNQRGMRYIYIWDAENEKFKIFPQKALGSEYRFNERTEANVRMEAVLKAQILGLNFTANYPYVCEKDGVYYYYDKTNGEFIKK